MNLHTLSKTEKTFISAYEDLRSNLLHGLLDAKEWSVDAWRPYFEVSRLLERLYNGKEKIIKNSKESVIMAN